MKKKRGKKQMSEEHFSYRKVTPEMVKQMKELKEKGLASYDIAKKLGVSQSTVLYHLNPDYRKKLMAKALERVKRITVKSPKKIEYTREYIKRRYREDEEFRERFKEFLRKSAKKRKKIVKKLRKEYPEYNEAWLNYFRNAYKSNRKEAYKIFKEKVLELRKKYNVNFPISR
jgi:predicted transcriptional regulator